MASIPVISLFVLSIQWIIFLAVLVGVYFAHNKKFPAHRKLFTWLAVVQILFILIMISVFLFSGTKNYSPIVYVHMAGGTFVALLVVYTVLTMNKTIPEKYRVPQPKRKLLMRVTALLWLLFIFSGSFVFLLTYVAT